MQGRTDRKRATHRMPGYVSAKVYGRARVLSNLNRTSSKRSCRTTTLVIEMSNYVYSPFKNAFASAACGNSFSSA